MGNPESTTLKTKLFRISQCTLDLLLTPIYATMALKWTEVYQAWPDLPTLVTQIEEIFFSLGDLTTDCCTACLK